MTIALIIAGIILVSLFMKTHARHRSPAKAAVVNMMPYTEALFAAAAFFGTVRVNMYTVFVALTLGLPGTCAITLGGLLL